MKHPTRNHVHAGLGRSVNRVEGTSLRRIFRVLCSVFLTIESVLRRDFANDFFIDLFCYLRKNSLDYFRRLYNYFNVNVT